MKSAFLKKHVFINLNGVDGYFKAFIEKVYLEADQPAYMVRYEDGRKEPIFASSIFRIWSAEQKAKIIPINKKVKLKVVK